MSLIMRVFPVRRFFNTSITMKKTILLPLLFIVFTGLMPPDLAASGAALPSVGYVRIEEKPAVLSRHYLGSVEAVNHVEVLTRTDGFIKSVHFAEGQMVEAGQLLMEIDPSVHASALERAQAGVKSAEATLTLKRLLNERAQALVSSRGISRNEADTAFADFSVAVAALQQANAALHLAELELSFTRITAPISGRAGLSRVSAGAYVHQASGPLVDIVQLDPIRVVIPVAEADFITAASGEAQGAFDLLGKDFAPQLRLADGRIYPERGSLDAVANRVDPMTGTVALRARFSNKDLLLLPGGVVDVTLDSQNPALKAAVPAVALQQDREGYFVLLLDSDNRVEQRPIQLGPRINQYYVVEQGLEVGDRVVVDGIQRIRPGIQVLPAERTLSPE